MTKNCYYVINKAPGVYVIQNMTYKKHETTV